MKAIRFISSPNRLLLPAWIGAGVVLLLTVIVLLPAVPFFYHMPNTDNAIFLLIGKKILAGQLPFRDWYDHKPPLIFYLNALGLWIGQGSRLGVWAVELVSLSTASLFGFALLRRYFGSLIAGLAMGCTLLNLAFVHDRGNLTEEYALPFQFAAIFFLAEIERTGRSGWRLFVIGCMVAMASSLKQPLAGIVVAIFAYLLLQYASQDRWRELLRAFGLVLLGFVAVWLAWFLYFAAVGIFPEFWEAAFAYNFALSGIPLEKRLRALVNGLSMLWGWSDYFLAGMLAWLAVIPYLLLNDLRLLRTLVSRLFGALLLAGGLFLLVFGLLRQNVLLIPGVLALIFGAVVFSGWIGRRFAPWWERRMLSGQTGLFLPLIVATVDLPVAVVFSSLSGNNFAHYFMALLPSLTLLLAFALYSLLTLMRGTARYSFAYAWLVPFAVLVFSPGILETVDRIGPRGDRQIEAVIDYVNTNTQPGDYVYQWGIVPQVNLISGREAPSRYFFPDPLFVDGYSGSTQTAEFLRDLQANPPVLIIDEQIERLPLLLPKDPNNCEAVRGTEMYTRFVNEQKSKVPYDLPQMPAGMDEVYYWICQNYEPMGPVGELGWPVYRLKGK